MRTIAVATCWLLAVSPASADGRLNGHVVEDGAVRIARPATPVAAPADRTLNTSAGQCCAAGKLDTAAFDLNASQRPAAITDGALEGWVQSMQSRSFNGRDIQASMDRFFASAHAQPTFSYRLSAGGWPAPVSNGGDVAVFVRMGLCGPWDARGEGRMRWARLASELYSNGPLRQAWLDWQRTVSSNVQEYSAPVQAAPGLASLHVVVAADGQIRAITPYDGPERPGRGAVNDPVSNQALTSVLRAIQVPPFPTGSQVPEAHILVFTMPIRKN